jgi:hypothetical protein
MKNYKFRRGDLIEILDPYNEFVRQDNYPNIGDLGFIEGVDNGAGEGGWFFVRMSNGDKETLQKDWMKKVNEI